MSAPAPVAADGLVIGRGALRQLHITLFRQAPDVAITILQETGYAAGAGVFQAFCAWLPGETGVAQPEDLDARRLNEVLSSFFQSTGWGSVSVSPLGGAALVVDSSDWAEADPGTAGEPMCFFTAGLLADFLGRLSGEPVAVMEVECRSKNDARCRFLSAAPDTLNSVYEQMSQGQTYEQVLGTS